MKRGPGKGTGEDGEAEEAKNVNNIDESKISFRENANESGTSNFGYAVVKIPEIIS